MPGGDLPDKLFFKIGEVAQIVGVRAHVLRYWESEFNVLRPLKTRGAHRVYRRRDVELAVLLRRLLHEEGLTIAGAKRRLRESGQHRVARPAVPSVVREVNARADLLAMRAELVALLEGVSSIVEGKGTIDATPVADVAEPSSSAVTNNVSMQAARRPPA